MVYRGLRKPVAKHSRRFNKAATHVDRKKRERRGYQKHRKGAADD